MRVERGLLSAGALVGVVSTLFLALQVNSAGYSPVALWSDEEASGYHIVATSSSRLTRQVYDDPQYLPRRLTAYQYQSPTARASGVDDKLCGSGPDFVDYFKRGVKQRSSALEDRTIYKVFFKNMSSLSLTEPTMQYVELGAFNGREESNTRFYDDCLQWDGLLIEANPEIYPDLVQNRPHTHRLSFAASCSLEEELSNKTVGFWRSRFTNAAEDKSLGRVAYAGGNPNRLVQVPCGSLTPVLSRLVPRVHFFSLDVEGMEPRVLETIDFARVYVDVFLIEVQNKYCRKKCASRDETRAIMRRSGYIRYSKVIPRSDIFVHAQSPFVALANAKMKPSELPTVVPRSNEQQPPPQGSESLIPLSSSTSTSQLPPPPEQQQQQQQQQQQLQLVGERVRDWTLYLPPFISGGWQLDQL